MMESKEGKLVVKGVAISSPSKIVFENPAVTKEEVVRYYETVAQRMLPYVKNRILSVVRCPKGVDEPCFFKKHPNHTGKGIGVCDIQSSDKEWKECFYIQDDAGLISEAQMGTLEFHMWGSLVGTVEKPDFMVFDLDPDEGMDIKDIRQGVKDLKQILDELSLVSYLKTSGGKGYHVVVPFKPSVSWDQFASFSKSIVEVMEKKWPERYTSNIRKNNRKNKIFIDWLRNGRGATSVAPYSLRARDGAKVSMPIRWDELNKIKPNDIDMNKAVRRLKKDDPWADFFDHHQTLR